MAWYDMPANELSIFCDYGSGGLSLYSSAGMRQPTIPAVQQWAPGLKKRQFGVEAQCLVFFFRP